MGELGAVPTKRVVLTSLDVMAALDGLPNDVTARRQGGAALYVRCNSPRSQRMNMICSRVSKGAREPPSTHVTETHSCMAARTRVLTSTAATVCVRPTRQSSYRRST